MKLVSRCVVMALGLTVLFAFWRFRERRLRLTAQVEELRRAAGDPAQARQAIELQSSHALLAQIERGGASRTDAIRHQLETARRDLRELEDQAQRNHAALSGKERQAVANRDPSKAFAQLEHFQNVGRATPAAAIQTLAWAAFKGDAALPACVVLSPSARQKAVDWLARLPAETRLKYPTPEVLGALLLSDEILKTTAIHIKDFTASDPDNGVVTLNALESGLQPIRIAVARDADGWKIVVAENALDRWQQRLNETPPAATTGR